jgi:multisubunit Na+/H+ antiporter MnhC subunit
MLKSFFRKQTNVQNFPKEIELTLENTEASPVVQNQVLRDDKASNAIESTQWWKLVPKPFLLLIVFCMGFALLSLGVLLLMGLNSSDYNGQVDTIDSTTSPVLNDSSTSIYLLWIGIASSILGSLQTASGYCSQRLGHQLEESTQKKNPLVFVGLLLLASGTIAAVINLGILGQSVTAPFAAMTLIFNGMLAYGVLNEKVTKVDVIATILVLFGVCIAVVGVGMAEMNVQKYVLADIKRLFFRSWFPTIYSIVLLTFLIGSYVIVMHKNLQKKNIGLCCFSIGAGLLSGFSSFCVKCSLEIVKSAAQNETSHDLENPLTFLFVLGMFVCLFCQLKFMGLGLKHFGTLKFVPPYHAFIIISNFVNGMVYFEESKSHTILSAFFFVIGCIITIGGVLLLLAKVPHGSSSTKKLVEATTSSMDTNEVEKEYDDVKV